MDRRVLCVDDDLAILRLLERRLANQGYEVLTAENGLEALHIMHAEGPSFVITDRTMPVMDGLQLCRELRASESVGSVYIIMLTAHSEIANLVEAFRAGADDFLVKPFHPQELLARLNAGVRVTRLEEELNKQARVIRKHNAEMAAMNHQLQRMAGLDDLTGLSNRREAMTRFDELWSSACRYNQSLCCVLMDIDHFKRINDDYGHHVGDEVLRQTSKTIRAATRAGEPVFRIGGEEFLILCANASLEAAAATAERVRRHVEAKLIETDGRQIRVTISAGIAERELDMRTSDDLMQKADANLYEAKRAGRNRVHVAEALQPVTNGKQEATPQASCLPETQTVSSL